MKAKKLIELVNDYEGLELFDAIDFAIIQMISGAIAGSTVMPDINTYDRLVLLRKALHEVGELNTGSN